VTNIKMLFHCLSDSRMKCLNLHLTDYQNCHTYVIKYTYIQRQNALVILHVHNQQFA